MTTIAGKMRTIPVSASLAAAVAAAILASALMADDGRAAGSAYVRVNQMGYGSAAPKRAFLMAPAAESGATFTVVNGSGTTVYSAAIGASQGSWSTPYPDVYALDFDSVTTPG